jgi:hypothetical protein
MITHIFPAGEPIEARRDSLPYILRRRAARYRNLLMTVCVLLVWLSVLGIYTHRRAERQEAAAQASELARVASE